MNDCWPEKLNDSSNDLLPWKQYVGKRLEVFVGSRYKIRYQEIPYQRRLRLRITDPSSVSQYR